MERTLIGKGRSGYTEEDGWHWAVAAIRKEATGNGGWVSAGHVCMGMVNCT